MIEASFDAHLLKDTTVVMPSLSFANNDLKAVETLVHQLSLKKIGSLFSPNLQPVIFEQSSHTACDVYQSLEVYPRLTVICIRSRVVGMSDFMSQLEHFLAQVDARMFMLSSLASLFSVHDGSEVSRLRGRGLDISLNVKNIHEGDELMGCGLLRYVVDNDHEMKIKCLTVTAGGPDSEASQLLVRGTIAALQIGSETRDA